MCIYIVSRKAFFIIYSPQHEVNTRRPFIRATFKSDPANSLTNLIKVIDGVKVLTKTKKEKRKRKRRRRRPNAHTPG